MPKKKETKKKTPTKKSCGGCKSDTVRVETPDRVSYSLGIKTQVKQYEPIDIAHSYSASAEPGETPEELNLRVAKQTMEGFKKVYAEALSELVDLKGKAFNDMLDEEK